MVLKLLSITSLRLEYFRSYTNYSFSFDKTPIVITGNNGVGKTSILEAISLLSPGKGIRGTKFSEILNNKSSSNFWEANFYINGIYGPSDILMRFNKNGSNAEKREMMLNGERIRSNSDLAKISSVIWLTPQMDNLFCLAASDRRKFFDRMVYNFNTDHAEKVTKYEYYMRERNAVLKDIYYDPSWLEIIESKMAALGVSIANSRVEAASYLQEAMDDATTNFPKADIKINGVLENLIGSMKYDELQNHYQDLLKKSRIIDAKLAKTSIGPHRSDMILTHLVKNQEAAFCSTGEQKALLISLVLADIRAKIKRNKIVPIVLFDEIIAHLDEIRKIELFGELIDMKCQFFLTGVKAKLFSYLDNKAQFIEMK